MQPCKHGLSLLPTMYSRVVWFLSQFKSSILSSLFVCLKKKLKLRFTSKLEFKSNSDMYIENPSFPVKQACLPSFHHLVAYYCPCSDPIAKATCNCHSYIQAGAQQQLTNEPREEQKVMKQTGQRKKGSAEIAIRTYTHFVFLLTCLFRLVWFSPHLSTDTDKKYPNLPKHSYTDKKYPNLHLLILSCKINTILCIVLKMALCTALLVK